MIISKIKKKALLFNVLIWIIIGTTAFVALFSFPKHKQPQTIKPVHISIDGDINRYLEIDGCVYVQGPTYVIHDNEQCERCKQQHQQELQQLADMIISALKN